MKTLHLIILAALACLLASCDKLGTNAPASKPTAYDRVIQSGTLRVGYIHYPPGFTKDPNNGKLSGIMHDVLVEACRNAEIKVEFVEEVGWGTMIEAVKSGRVDLVCTGLWPNSARGKLVDFTNSIYYSPIKTFVKAGNTAFDGRPDSINAETVKIAALDGEMTSIIAKFDYPKAKLNTLPQTADVSQVLLEVSTGKADVTFVEPAIANEFLAKNPGSIQEVAGMPPVRVFPNVFMVGKGEAALTSTLNIAIDELYNTGFVEKTVAKYEKRPGELLRRSPAYSAK